MTFEGLLRTQCHVCQGLSRGIFWDVEAWPGPRRGHTQSSEGARAVEGMWEGHQGLDIKEGFLEVVP